MSENGSDYSFNQNSRNNSASGVTWSDDHHSETLASQNHILHDSNLSLSKTTKSYSNQSLSDIKSTNSSKDDGKGFKYNLSIALISMQIRPEVYRKWIILIF